MTVTMISSIKSVDKRLGKSVCSTTSGVRGYLSGKWNIVRASMASEVPRISSKNKENGEKLKQNEYIILGQPYYDDDLISIIKSKYENHIEDDSVAYTVQREGTIYTRQLSTNSLRNGQVFDFEKHIPEVEELITSDVRDIVQEYYNSHFKVAAVSMYRNHHIPQEVAENHRVFAQNWHLDGDRPTDYIKLFVNISDVTDKHGPLHLLPRNVTRKYLSPDYDRFSDGAAGGKLDTIENPQKCVGPKGTAMIGNTCMTLHRAGIPDENRTRDFLQMSLVPSSEPLPSNWLTDSSYEFIDSFWDDRILFPNA